MNSTQQQQYHANGRKVRSDKGGTHGKTNNVRLYNVCADRKASGYIYFNGRRGRPSDDFIGIVFGDAVDMTLEQAKQFVIKHKIGLENDWEDISYQKDSKWKDRWDAWEEGEKRTKKKKFIVKNRK